MTWQRERRWRRSGGGKNAVRPHAESRPDLFRFEILRRRGFGSSSSSSSSPLWDWRRDFSRSTSRANRNSERHLGPAIFSPFTASLVRFTDRFISPGHGNICLVTMMMIWRKQSRSSINIYVSTHGSNADRISNNVYNIPYCTVRSLQIWTFY